MYEEARLNGPKRVDFYEEGVSTQLEVTIIGWASLRAKKNIEKWPGFL